MLSSSRVFASGDPLDQRIDGRIGDAGDVARPGRLGGLRAVDDAQAVARRRRAGERAARHVEVELVHAALILRRVDDARARVDAEPLQIGLEGLRVRLQRDSGNRGTRSRRACRSAASGPLLRACSRPRARARRPAAAVAGPGPTRRETGGTTGSPKTDAGSLPRNGSSSASSSAEGRPFAFMSEFSKIRRRALVEPEHDVLVRPLEIEGEADRLADARILERLAAQVEVPALDGRRRIVRDLLALDAAFAHGREIVAGRPDARGDIPRGSSACRS